MKKLEDAKVALQKFLSRKSAAMAQQQALTDSLRKQLNDAETERQAALDEGNLDRLTAATSRATIAQEALQYAENKLQTMDRATVCTQAEREAFDAFLDDQMKNAEAKASETIIKAFRDIAAAASEYKAVADEASDIKNAFLVNVCGESAIGAGWYDQPHALYYASMLLDRIRSDGYLDLA